LAGWRRVAQRRTMNITELASVISEEHSLSESFSIGILKTVLNTIRKELKQGHPVRLRNFGTFQVKKSHGKLRAKFDDSSNIFK
jgi:nucleoid DNA-binding protein